MSQENLKLQFKLDQPYFDNKSYIIPTKCPHCEICSHPKTITAESLPYPDLVINKSVGIKVTYPHSGNLDVLMHQCILCEKHYFTLHLHYSNNKNPKFLLSYPSVSFNDVPTILVEHYPRFAEIYKQAHAAEQLDHIELAATGYRMSLEILAKDFAISENPEDEDKIKELSLNNCLQQYFQDMSSSVSGHVVKSLGNDYAHYIRKHMDVEFSELKYYLNIFLENIEKRLKLKHPPTRVPVLKTQK